MSSILEKKPFQFWREICIWIVVILLQLYVLIAPSQSFISFERLGYLPTFHCTFSRTKPIRPDHTSNNESG